jgi:hypothetical protein
MLYIVYYFYFFMYNKENANLQLNTTSSHINALHNSYTLFNRLCYRFLIYTCTIINNEKY